MNKNVFHLFSASIDRLTELKNLSLDIKGFIINIIFYNLIIYGEGYDSETNLTFLYILIHNKSLLIVSPSFLCLYIFNK